MMISFLQTLHLINTVSAHAYIKTWSADGGEFHKAQKQPLGNTAFRGVSKNTGWIGSKFIETPAITCGAEDTPKGKIAAPIAPFFHTADQAAKKSLSVKAGGEIDLVITGEPGKGFPHPNGHIQTYLGYCGAEENSCANFDASKANYFKIQAEVNAISEKLRPNFDHQADGNKWKVPIPSFIPQGSYIMRLELITFGQSSDQEGKQDQYYVYCGQLHITGSRAPAHDLSRFDSVQFPGAYKAGNIAKDHLPGPKVVSKAEGNQKVEGTQKSEGNQSKGCKPKKSTVGSGLSTKLTACDGTCFKAKTTPHELKHLAPSCSPEDFTCLCRSHKWICAYVSCAEGNCKGEESKKASDEVYSKCGAILSSRSRLSTTDYIPEHQNPSSKEISKSESCMNKCFGSGKQLGHSTCRSGDLDCVCKDHAAVCAWAKCAETNCQDNTDTIRLASDAIYEKCYKITSSPVRRHR